MDLFVAYYVPYNTLIIYPFILSNFSFLSLLALSFSVIYYYIFYGYSSSSLSSYYISYSFHYFFLFFFFLPSYLLFYCSSNSILPSLSIKSFQLFNPSTYFSLFSQRSQRTALFLNAACKVLFFLIKQILKRPSHYKQSKFGLGFFGQILTIELSTLGGGLKLFRPTLIRWSTRASSCTLTLNRQYKSDPGLAINLCANYFWNIKTAHRKVG